MSIKYLDNFRQGWHTNAGTGLRYWKHETIPGKRAYVWRTNYGVSHKRYITARAGRMPYSRKSSWRKRKRSRSRRRSRKGRKRRRFSRKRRRRVSLKRQNWWKGGEPFFMRLKYDS